VEELEGTAGEFEETLQKQQEEAMDAVNQWSTRYSELEAAKSELEEALQNQQEEALDAVNQWSTMYSQLEELKSELEDTLQKQQDEASNAVSQWSTRYSELLTVKSELEEKLQKHQDEASAALNECSTSYSELKTHTLDIELELEKVSRERDELSGMLEKERESFGKDAVSRIKIDFAKAKSDWELDKERLQFQVDELEAAALVSSQNLNAAEEQVSKMKIYATETDDAWKGKFIAMRLLLESQMRAFSHAFH
jgi:chromosome segregation ATPase